MTFKNFVTHDSISRCVLCDAPVGVKSGSLEENPTYNLLGEPYCEFCGIDVCPYCGISKKNEEVPCSATDVNFYKMHYGEYE